MYACSKEVTDDAALLARDVLNHTDHYRAKLKREERTAAPEGDDKVSCRGCSKRTNKYGDICFMEVLRDQKLLQAVNYSFRYLKHKLFLHKQIKRGGDYEFWKRWVEPDGLTTRHLDYDFFSDNK